LDGRIHLVHHLLVIIKVLKNAFVPAGEYNALPMQGTAMQLIKVLFSQTSFLYTDV
jgi:hypothetical protein